MPGAADKSFIDDVLVQLLREIANDESIRIEELPNRFTKKNPVGPPKRDSLTNVQ